MYDSYPKAIYESGPITLKTGDSTTFSNNADGNIPSKEYVIQLTSVEGDVAKLDINAASERLERGFDYSIDLIRMRSINYSDDSVTIVPGSGTYRVGQFDH